MLQPVDVRVPPLSEAVVALLIDRDDDTRSMYAEYLRFAHYAIEEAADGREGLAKAIARRPNIVVTETRLPGIDGFDLCRLLREDALTRMTPILVVTADAYARDMQRAREARADEVLIKPCLPEVLLAEITRLLAASASLRDRSERVREKAGEQIGRSARLIEYLSVTRRSTLARSHNRHQTAAPPLPPPQLVCPQCDASLTYDHSNIGGVSARHSEQWDYYGCPAGCGTFQYRQRTRKLRKV